MMMMMINDDDDDDDDDDDWSCHGGQVVSMEVSLGVVPSSTTSSREHHMLYQSKWLIYDVEPSTGQTHI